MFNSALYHTIALGVIGRGALGHGLDAKPLNHSPADLEEGRSTPMAKLINDKADELANQGADRHISLQPVDEALAEFRQNLALVG